MPLAKSSLPARWGGLWGIPLMHHHTNFVLKMAMGCSSCANIHQRKSLWSENAFHRERSVSALHMAFAVALEPYLVKC